MTTRFDLRALLSGVFEPQPGETVLVACDVPTPALPDRTAWQDRRKMAEEWQAVFAELGRERGFTTWPLLTFPATGANGADLPIHGELGGASVEIEPTLLSVTLAVFLTEFSATAALDAFCKRKEDFRAASLPGLERRMEQSALSADYREVARRCHILADALQNAASLEVRFSTGHTCRFDLRFRSPEMDDGYLPRFKPGDRIINLPSGETFVVPYEGERKDVPSQTAGILPVALKGEHLLLHVEGNRIQQVEGEGPEAQRFALFFAADPARCNIAEVAFGCNDRAIVTGNVLEDEKAGFHWAYGRSSHLGGVVGVGDFTDPSTVVHQDIVYAKGNPIQVQEAVVSGPGGDTIIIRDGEYVVF